MSSAARVCYEATYKANVEAGVSVSEALILARFAALCSLSEQTILQGAVPVGELNPGWYQKPKSVSSVAPVIDGALA